MYLELRFTQKLRSATLVQDSKWLDITLRQTAVKGDASRTQMVVMSFGQGNGGGGKLQKHASTHFKGGSDTIKPYDIDAAKRGGDKGQDFAAREVDSDTVKVAGQIVSANHIGGLLGAGFKFDAQKGELELRKLRVWEELITSVLVKNEVQIMRNEMWFTDGGTVAGLIADGSLTNDQRRVQFKEKPSFRTGDLLKAIIEFTDGGAGFRTAQYRVDTLHADGFTVTVTLVNGIEPVQDMVVARIGNDTDVERQKSVYIDGLTGYIRQLGGMTSFEVTAANVLWHIGNTSGLAALGIDNSEYTDTLYMPSLHVTGDQLIGGRINALDGFNLIDFGKSLVDGLRFRLGDKGSFMQFLDGVFELHNVRLISKDGTISEGKDGKDGNYSVSIYRWTDGAKPERPSGVGTGAVDPGDPTDGGVDPSPDGWSLDTDKGVVITNEKGVAIAGGNGVPIAGDNGAVIAGENGAVLLNAYPDDYKLWKSEGTFDGSTHELIGAWSDPYQVSATDGKDGKDGQYNAPEYKVSPTKPTGVGSTLPPTVPSGSFLWMRTGVVIPPATTPAEWSDYVQISGEVGPTGADGRKQPYYDYSFGYSTALTSPSAATAPTPTPTWVDTPPDAVADSYLWQRVVYLTPKADNSGWEVLSGNTKYARLTGGKGKDVDPAVQNDIAKQFGFGSMPAMSEYLKNPANFPYFDYDPATGILRVSKVLASAVAANEAFINKLIAQEAFIKNLVARSIDTRVYENNNPNGTGVVISKGYASVDVYDDGQAEPCISLYKGDRLGDMQVSPEVVVMSGNRIAQFNDYALVFNNPTCRSEYADNGITLPPSAVIDMPGVLLWAHGYSNGGTIFYNGAKKHTDYTITKIATGTYRVYHSIGHTEYVPHVAIQRVGNWNGAWNWQNKTANYIEIIISGLDNNPADRDFDITLIGKN